MHTHISTHIYAHTHTQAHTQRPCGFQQPQSLQLQESDRAHNYAHTHTNTHRGPADFSNYTRCNGRIQTNPCTHTQTHKHTQTPCRFQQPHSLQWKEIDRAHVHARTHTNTHRGPAYFSNHTRCSGRIQTNPCTHTQTHKHTQTPCRFQQPH